MNEKVTAVIVAILSVFAPAQELLIATGILVIADMVTGILAARKLGQPITSAGLRRTVSKMLVYQLAVGSAFLVQHYMAGDAVPISNIVSSAIGLTELKSIIENVDKIRGSSILKDLLSRLGSQNDHGNNQQSKD